MEQNEIIEIPPEGRTTIYIAGPYRGSSAWDVEMNVRMAEVATLAIAKLGYVPLCPHTMYRHFDGTLTEQYWLDATLSLLSRCDAVVFVGDWKKSKGSLRERLFAEQIQMRIFDTLPELILAHGRGEIP